MTSEEIEAKLLFAIFGKTREELAAEDTALRNRVWKMLEDGMTGGAIQQVLIGEGISREYSYELIGELEARMFEKEIWEARDGW